MVIDLNRVIMRFASLIIGLLIVSLVFSQNNISFQRNIEWFEVKENKIADNQSVFFFGFDGASYDYGNQKITPFFNDIISWESGLDAEIQIVNVLTEKLKTDESELIDQSNISTNYNLKYEVSESRGRKYLIVSLLPFVKMSNGEIHKIKSFQLEISKVANQPLRQNQRMAFTNESVLSKGDWYKIGVTQNGVYKLSHSYLKDLGIDIDNISPDALNIYGNSFGMLPENNSTNRPDDLLKNSIYIEGDSDGIFNSNDYILFYAKGADNWVLNGTNFEHKRHQFSDTSYYFIHVDTASISPKRIANAILSSGTPTNQISSFNDYQIVHNDYYNLMKSGREWLGDHFDIVTEYSYPFTFPNLDFSQPVRLRMAIAAKTPGNSASSFNLTIPEAAINTSFSIPGVGSGAYPYNAIYANGGALIYNLSPTSSSMNVNLKFNPFSASSEGWNDFIEMNARRNLIFFGNNMEFRDINSIGPGNISEFQLNTANPQTIIWEVTEPTNVEKIVPTINSSLFSFNLNTDTLRTFIAFTPQNLSVPKYFGKVANQNLHGLSFADMLIITHPDFISEATDLSNFHQSEGLSVNLVTTQQVYNEFSSGMKDITAIRMFFKMFYDRASGDTTLMPKYALLFGDGSYDNKYRLPGNTSFIPTYQSASGAQMYIISSFTSDDYFAMLDDSEGFSGGNLMDIAVGRLCVKNSTEANAVVNKIKAYSTEIAPPLNAGCCDNEVSSTMGDWRNWVTFIADDEDYNAYINSAENFSDQIEMEHPDYLIKKIFIDAYLQTSTPGGKRYYDADKDLREKVQSGSLFVNYIGHGGEVGWAHERILDLATINNWTNSPRLPLFMSATCEFSRFDDPARTSAGEYVLLNPAGGGIALMTTTRLVISGPNEQLNGYLVDFFLKRGPNNGRQKLGDLYLDSKNKMATLSPGNSTNTRNFTLLGDPAVEFKIPYHNVVTDSVNGVAISGSIDTLKALSVITIAGRIQDENGNFLNNFNGIITPVVFDKDQMVTSLANDSPGSIPKTFNSTKNVIYKGKATVTNGLFKYSFVVPKDISFQFGNGKLSYYAHNYSTDANGSNNQIIVGGVNTNAPLDTEGPQMEIYLNDDNFVSGGITNSNPFLIVEAEDENGLNTVGNGIGHDLTAVLDGNTSNTIILNEYYETELDTYQKGRIKFQLTDLAPGNHTLKVKIWDVYNNSSEKEIDFIVQEEQELVLDHVLNYPNPFTTNTVFMLEHNQVCQTLDIKISVMTVTGKVVKTILQTVNAEGFRIDPIAWDGLDDYGDKLAIGTYIYKVEVTAGEKKVDQYEKLVILR